MLSLDAGTTPVRLSFIYRPIRPQLHKCGPADRAGDPGRQRVPFIMVVVACDVMVLAVRFLALQLQPDALPGLTVDDPWMAALQVVLGQLPIVLHPFLCQGVLVVGLLRSNALDNTI